MHTENPYAAPESSPEPEAIQVTDADIQLASRWTRLLAAIIDSILLVALVLPMMMMVFGFSLSDFGITNFTQDESAYEDSGYTDEEYYDYEYASSSSSLQDKLFNLDDKLYGLISITLAILVNFAINAYFLVKHGQSVGKKLLSIQIICYDSKKLLSPWRVLGMRTALPTLITIIPVLEKSFPLIDSLFIFSKDKRCVHDYMANSIVVKKIL